MYELSERKRREKIHTLRIAQAMFNMVFVGVVRGLSGSMLVGVGLVG